jgi:hypothetical protein
MGKSFNSIPWNFYIEGLGFSFFLPADPLWELVSAKYEYSIILIQRHKKLLIYLMFACCHPYHLIRVGQLWPHQLPENSHNFTFWILKSKNNRENRSHFVILINVFLHSSILGLSWSGNHPQEDLAKCDLKQDIKVKKN